MERTERVEKLSAAFNAVVSALYETVDSIRAEMSAKVHAIHELKQGLSDDVNELADIASMVDGFRDDLGETVESMDNLLDATESILFSLDDVPCSIDTVDPDEDEDEDEDEPVEEETEQLAE